MPCHATRALPLLLALLLCTAPTARAREDLSRWLTFEDVSPTATFGGWGSRTRMAQLLDSVVVHEGRYALRLDRDTTSPGPFTSVVISLPVDFRGDSLELRGWMRWQDVGGWVGLWLREDTRSKAVGFDNMADRGLSGTSDWVEQRIVLPLDRRSRTVVLGALIVGTGRLWVDDLRVSIDGRPLAEAPVVDRITNAYDTDHEFDAGSRVTLTAPTALQVADLVLLGKVWGFLKYHHPAAVQGRRQWDYELFRLLPRVLEARDGEAARTVLAAWMDSLGAVPPCTACAERPVGRPVMPRLRWIDDERLLGPALRSRLREVHDRRPQLLDQATVHVQEVVTIPEFGDKLEYPALREPDPGYRLLGLFRFWNIVEYWAPDRELASADWDGVLREFIPRMMSSTTRDDYARTALALAARVNDTHCSFWGVLGVRPPQGTAALPVITRSIQGHLLVTGFRHRVLGPASGLRIGDEVLSLDGEPVATLFARWRPWYPASNEPTRLRELASAATTGPPGTVQVGLERGRERLTLAARRIPRDSLDTRTESAHVLPGPAFRRLSPDLAYLKLGDMRADDVPGYLKGLEGARALVIDMRDYPWGMPLDAFGRHLVARPTPFAKFTRLDPSNPGSFTWTAPETLQSEPPLVDARIALLVDEVTQSSAEYHTMAFRARPGTLVVGSTTAGADGNVASFALPGGLQTMITGLGVYWPDGRPTQGVGIVPDVVVRPTVAGIRAGRDEVFETAIQRLLGRGLTAEERAALAVPDAAAPASSGTAPGDSQSLVDAEHAFARLAADANTRDAFLAVLDDSGVVFQPLAVNGKRFHAGRPVRPSVLAWEPEYAEVAGSGDLGFTTGPWSFRPTKDDTAVAFGHYVSVWRRADAGPWRLHADLGVSHEKPASLTPTPELRTATRPATKPAGPAPLTSLRAAEVALRGGASLARAAAADVRVLHGDRAPAVGAAGIARLRGESADTRWTLADLAVSRAGDLGYARGLRFAADTASFVRMWRRERGGWRVALDIETPSR